MTLSLYKKKRDFTKTNEPAGSVAKAGKLRFVVQRHHASHIHYDFRLEMGGVLKSWAVPKGPSLNPTVKRLAMHVEDHPVDYIDFEGLIPKGNYGAGTVEVWDAGSYTTIDENGDSITEKQALAGLKKGTVKVVLKGKKLRGEFALVMLKNNDGKSWLLIKHRDEYAVDTEYNSEDFSRNKRKEDKVAGDTSANEHRLIAKKPSRKNATKKGSKTESSPGKDGKPVSAESDQQLITFGNKKLELTNLNKIFWPADGYTKGDLINYYEKAADYILPYLRNRPLSLKRNPNGIADEGFYHKDAGEAAPAWVKHADLYSESADKIIHYIICNDKPTLLYLANLGCIEMNPWNSTATKLENPTYRVIDLDPAEGNSFDQVIEAAQVVNDVLGKAGVSSFCKTSGASGLHVYVPLGNKYGYDVAKAFAHVVASLVQEQLPFFTSLERNLKKRGNNIYIDFLQNRTGQTLAAAYSVRPKEGAIVSAPLHWDEVKPGLSPTQFTIHNIFERLEKKGDLFTPVLGRGINLKKSLRLLDK